MRDRIFIQR